MRKCVPNLSSSMGCCCGIKSTYSLNCLCFFSIFSWRILPLAPIPFIPQLHFSFILHGFQCHVLFLCVSYFCFYTALRIIWVCVYDIYNVEQMKQRAMMKTATEEQQQNCLNGREKALPWIEELRRDTKKCSSKTIIFNAKLKNKWSNRAHFRTISNGFSTVLLVCLTASSYQV